MKKYYIRRHALDMTSKMWLALDKYYPDNPFLTTPEEFLELIGLPGGKTSCYTLEEREFFNAIYDLWRKRDKQ